MLFLAVEWGTKTGDRSPRRLPLSDTSIYVMSKTLSDSPKGRFDFPSASEAFWDMYQSAGTFPGQRALRVPSTLSGEGCGPRQCFEAQVGRVGIRISQSASRIAWGTQDTPTQNSTALVMGWDY